MVSIVQEPRHQSPRHATTRDCLLSELQATAPTGYFVRCHGGLVLPNLVLSPDLMLVRGTPRSFSRQHPGAESTTVVLEISEASAERDRVKAGRCREAGIPMALVINLDDRLVEVYDFGAADDNVERRVRSRIVRKPAQVGEVPLGDIIGTTLSWLQEIDAEQDSLQTE